MQVGGFQDLLSAWSRAVAALQLPITMLLTCGLAGPISRVYAWILHSGTEVKAGHTILPVF